ncbi:MAG TPA: hypothetical protein VG406_22405 [Isosphaeraceae bacterium]|nr:hypothetical protein [Isosphaeraceae bacterium]
MTRLRVASAAIVAVGVIGAGAAAGRGDDPKPAPKGDNPAGKRVILRWPDRPVHESDVTYQLLSSNPSQTDSDAPAALRRVEAYAIGDEVYINVAPPGSGRLVLERVANRTTPIEEKPATKQPDATKKADAPKKPDATKNADAPKKADSRVDAVRALDDLRVDLTDLFIAGNPADPTDAARLEKLTAGAYNLGDTAFARRIYLETLGRVPTDDEVRTYVESDAPDKAEILARRLVDDPAAFEQIKKSLLRRAAERVAETRRAAPAPRPVRFTLADVTLDRVNLPAGDLIDIHLDNGPHDPQSATAEQQQTFFSTHNGQLIAGVSPPATRILGLPVAVDATLRIESAEGVVTTGTGEGMLKQLKPGMRLTLEFVAEGFMLAVRSITARPAPRTTDVPYDPLFQFYPQVIQPDAPPRRR